MPNEVTICCSCNGPIKTRIITALDKTWHPEHFVCKICLKPISENKFNEKEGQPVCSQCFLDKYTDTCCACQKPIKEKVIKALGKSWHEEHFVCGGPCKSSLSGQSFYEREGKPYCKPDFEFLFAARCAGCHSPIANKAIVALDAKWHSDCFKCKMCQTAITTSSFAVEDNKPLCTKCAA